MSALTPERIMQVANGFAPSKALLSAVGLGLCTRLADQGPITLEEIVEAFGLQRRPAMDLLVSLDLLARQGDGEGARYANTAETAAFLDRDSPDYVGGILEIWETRNYRSWANLTEALRTGQAQSEMKTSGKSFFETLYADPEKLTAFLDAMTGASRRSFQRLAQVFPFQRFRSLTDVGGADALLSRSVAAAHPHLRCASLDLPAVTDIARRRIAEDGLEDRIEAVAGDFLADPLPRAEVITMGMILHDWGLAQKRLLVRKAYEALAPGGAFIVIEALIDDARRQRAFGLSLNMLIEFGDASDYTTAEFATWCREAGFTRFEEIPLADGKFAGVAWKG